MQDPYNFNNDRSVSGFDLTQVLTVNWVYQLPFGPGMKWNPSNKVLSHIIGNWQVNGIVLLRSGTPYNLTVPGDSANTANNGYLRPDYIGGSDNLTTHRRRNGSIPRLLGSGELHLWKLRPAHPEA